jgi:hypothetical protein
MTKANELGIAWVLAGGILNGTYVLPMKRMAAWSWENTWMAYSLIATVILPWALAVSTVPHLGDVYGSASWGVLMRVSLSLDLPGESLVMALIWFGGVAAYGIGAVSLGNLGGVVGWPLLMSMTVIGANAWGAATGEWKGANRSSLSYWSTGLSTLMLAIYIISLGGAT